MDLLRARLDELEEQGNLKFDFIDKIRNEINHSIRRIEEWPADIPGKQNFNCVMYALNLRDDLFHNSVASNDLIRRAIPNRDNNRRIHADTEFLQFCIESGSMPIIRDGEQRPGDLLVYKDSGSCRHIGKVVEQDRIRSKWGLNDLLEHKLLEVPGFYGDKRQYVERLTREQSRGLFIKYARRVISDIQHIKAYLEQEINKHW